MVLGLFEGSVEIQLNGSSFSPGQKIPGTLTLRLSQPKRARELRLEFYGEITTRTRKHSRTERVFQVRQQLSASRDYRGGETFSFELPVPQGVTIQAPGIFGTIVGLFTPHPKYFVHASLDVANEFDINKRVPVTINGGMVNVQQVPTPGSKEEAAALEQRNAEAERKMRAPPEKA